MAARRELPLLSELASLANRMSQDDGEPEWFTYRTVLTLGGSKPRINARFSRVAILIFSVVVIMIVFAALVVRSYADPLTN